MPSLPDELTYKEWLVLLQEDAEQARQHLAHLHKQLGPKAAPGVIISIEEYAKAQELITLATADATLAERLAQETAVGRAMLEPYPDRQRWEALAVSDPTFARKLLGGLHLKLAMLGLDAPAELIASIEAYPFKR